MKNIKNILLIFLFGALIIQSCKKDLSSLDNTKIGDFKVDTQADAVIDVLQFDHLVINPNISTTLEESNLSYQWRINLKPSDTLSQILSNTKNLDVEIKLRPNDFGRYYQLWYEVTDRTTDLKYITTWRINVRNAIGEGLVIAEVAEDGISSDISHLMSPLVTASFTGESLKRGVYSGINHKTIPGIIKQMRFTNIFGVNTIFTITNNSISKINTLDYTLGGVNDDLFFGHTGPYAPQSLYGIRQGDLYIENGKLTFTYLGAARKFGLPMDVSFRVPEKIALDRSETDVTVNFYDEVNGYFVYLPSLNYGDKKMYRYPQSGGVFNPGNLPNKLNLAAGVDNTTKNMLHILKDKTSGSIGLYVIAGGAYPGAAAALMDLTSAPGISSATKFVVMDNQKVIYYATDTKVYAILYSGATATFEERFTVPADEKITTLDIYQQADYPFGSDYLPSNNNQLILSTFNTQGKLYLLPLKNLGLGNIDLPAVKSYGGFRKITAVTTQK